MNREVHVRICGGRPVRFRPPTRRVHAARTDALTLYTVSAQRGIEAMTEGGVLPALSRDAVLVHDFWAPYWHFDVTHAVCGASADDPSTSTCSTGSTAIATRCCATPRTCGSHSPTTAPSATSAR